MAFTKRKIDLTFTLGVPGDSFTATNTNTVKISGNRVECTITKSGGMSMSEATIRAFGVPLDIMNKLTILGQSIVRIDKQNMVTVDAGTDGQLATCFYGTISECWVDASNSPEVSLIVKAYTALLDLVRPVPATSFKGPVDVALMLGGIASKMTPPLGLENNGVNVVLRDPVYPGTYLQQIQEICRAANINFIVDNNITLAIWPKDGARRGLAQKISRDTGMIGYPIHQQSGITLTMEFNPTIAFGTYVDVESILTPNNGLWSVYTLSHDISSETVEGPWFTQIDCQVQNRPAA